MTSKRKTENPLVINQLNVEAEFSETRKALDTAHTIIDGMMQNDNPIIRRKHDIALRYIEIAQDRLKKLEDLMDGLPFREMKVGSVESGGDCIIQQTIVTRDY